MHSYKSNAVAYGHESDYFRSGNTVTLDNKLPFIFVNYIVDSYMTLGSVYHPYVVLFHLLQIEQHD